MTTGQASDSPATRIEVLGEVDLFTGPTLRDAVRQAVRRHEEVVLDLTHVAFMDCAGLRMLLDALDAAREAGASLSVTPPRAEQVRMLLELTGTAARLSPLGACGAEQAA